MSASPKLKLPRVIRVRLNSFSLFTISPNIDIEIPKGVFCLAGANGIGKSTFLAAVGYGITGIVPDPSVSFESINQYYKECMPYANEFFTGRITEDDRATATISIDYELGEQIFQITRAIFEPQELRMLKIIKSNEDTLVFDGKDVSPGERDGEYRNRVIEAVGLKSFEQFVFLILSVLTFDERRELLLWNHKRLIAAVFLAIGIDPEKAAKADWLKAERDACGSRARNFQWQASLLKREIASLNKRVKQNEKESELAPLRFKYDELIKSQLGKEEEVARRKSDLSDSELERMRVASNLSALQQEYSEVFTKFFHSNAGIRLQPFIKTSLNESTCAICGSKGMGVSKNIDSKIREGKCPLCDSAIKETPVDDSAVEILKNVDQKIAEMKKRFDLATKAKQRLSIEIKKSMDELEEIRNETNQLLLQNQALASAPTDNSAELAAFLRAKMQTMNDLIKTSNNEYEARDNRQIELLQLYDELRQRYIEAQTEFVPLFRKLASLFIGLDMNMQMEYSTSISTEGPQLVVEMEGTARREMYHLSESQRFFLDIALRMALTDFMSDPDGRACLFIDTPEGSLDIAYESRAGQMIAEFVENGHDVMMTANINSSQILKKMAAQCGKSKMTLYRMMPWVELSSVQQEEAPAFESAYQSIEAELERGGTKNG